MNTVAKDAILMNAGGDALITKLANAYGIDDSAARAAADQMLQALSVRIQRNMLSRAGVADVTALLTGNAQDAPRGNNIADPQHLEQGNQILDVLIGNKHVSRGIAARAAADAGIEPATAEQMLPVLANALFAALRSQSRPALQRLATGLNVGSPLSPPGDGSSAEADPQDASQTGGGKGQSQGPRDYGQPLPIPGEVPRSSRAPRGRAPTYPAPDRTPADTDDDTERPDEGDEPGPLDRLPDIIRRGGKAQPGGGGTIEDAIRNILGQLLGTGNRGVIGTMVQLFVIRFLAGIVRRTMSRVLGR